MAGYAVVRTVLRTVAAWPRNYADLELPTRGTAIARLKLMDTKRTVGSIAWGRYLRLCQARARAERATGYCRLAIEPAIGRSFRLAMRIDP